MNYNTDSVPSPAHVLDPEASVELLAELDPEMAGLVEDWRRAADAVHDARAAYTAAMPPPRRLEGRPGRDLAGAIAEVRRAARDGEDLETATAALAGVIDSRGTRLARVHAACALADVAAAAMVGRAGPFRLKVTERLRQLETEALAKLAGLYPRTIDQPGPARILAEVKDELDRNYLPLAALAAWTTRPRGPSRPRASLATSVQGRLAELEGRTLGTRFGGGHPITTTSRRQDRSVTLVV